MKKIIQIKALEKIVSKLKAKGKKELDTFDRFN